MKKYYILIASDLVECEFYDLKFDERSVLIYNTLRQIKSPALRLLRKIHLSSKINSFVKLPFRTIWSNAFPNGEINPISSRELNSLKHKKGAHLILFVGDHWTSNAAALARYYKSKVDFDYIFTINPGDAKSFGFLLHDLPYSKIFFNNNLPIVYDLFFIGRKKDRIAQLHDIFLHLNNNKVKSKYIICDVDEKEKENNGIIYNNYITYEETLLYTNKSNCILEVLTPGQTGASLRYYEAICYNKKLLTNNKNVVNLPFYNPDYMYIFEKAEDIDWDWVKERIPVDYHYDGRFSPVHIIDEIEYLEKNHKKFGKW